jgi:histidine phosphotransferase ChpT
MNGRRGARGRQGDADALFLAETLATRLCHDLSGQVNAMVGAVEVMQHDATDPEALGLATDAGDSLVRRLRLARSAWGGLGGPMTVDEWRTLVDGMARRGVRLDLDGVTGSGCFAPAAARLALNVMLLASECLPAGGVIEAAGDPDQDLLVRITGPRAAWPSGLAAMIADPDEAMEILRQADAVSAARSLQASLTAMIAHAGGQRLSFLFSAEAEAAPPLLVGLVPVH